MVILNENRGRLSVDLVQHRFCELLIDHLVDFPVMWVKYWLNVSIMAKRPKRFI